MNSKLLLDTHTLVWLTGDMQVGPKTKQLVQDADIVYVSVISILELKMKRAAGKLPEAEEIIRSIEPMHFTILELNKLHLDRFKIFDKRNRDPFDNVLISVALEENARFVTSDNYILNGKIPKLKTINAKT